MFTLPTFPHLTHYFLGDLGGLNPLTPMSDQDRISSYYINTISTT